MSNYEDVLYETVGRTAIITINRPTKYNAFRPRTVVELIDAFQQAGWNRDIGSVVFTGAGTKAFCTGGDQSDHSGGQYGNNDARGAVGMPAEELHSVIRDIPKPVIAKVRGYAIGGGNVLCTLCDMTIASDNAIFGQVGPKMGSVDPGFGTAYLARVVGDKKAREMWYMCKRYHAKEALDMGLQCRGTRRGAGCRSAALVRRAEHAQSDGHRLGQEEFQCRHRIHPRHGPARDAGAAAVLQHRRVAGRCEGAE